MTGKVAEKQTPTDLKKLVDNQPVVAAIAIPECLKDAYKVDKDKILPNCLCPAGSGKTNILKEFVTIVGFDTTKVLDGDAYAQCSGYWIARHSWGNEYGKDGIIRLCILKDGETTNKKTKKTKRVPDRSGVCKVQELIFYPDLEYVPKPPPTPQPKSNANVAAR